MEIAQVLFRDEENNLCAGIRLDDGRVICGCCGGILEPEEITIVKVFHDWEDISDAIADLDDGWENMTDDDIARYE